MDSCLLSPGVLRRGWTRQGEQGREVQASTMFLKRPSQPHRSSKHKDLVEDQPFPGLLRTENLGLEELAHVLRAAVVDQKGEGSLLLLCLPCCCRSQASSHILPSLTITRRGVYLTPPCVLRAAVTEVNYQKKLWG